jgi:hypothetical protein
VQAAGIPRVSVTMLNAPEGTPLRQRLVRDGRLTAAPMQDMYLTTNVVPKQMTREELRHGTQWLLNRLYAPDAFLERVAVLAAHLPPAAVTPNVPLRAAIIWQKLVGAYERLGPDFARVPREAVLLFRGRDTAALGTALIFYKSVVSVLRRWELWDPALARLAEPAFERVAS